MKNFLSWCIKLLSIGGFAQNVKSVAQKVGELNVQKTNFQKFNVLNVTSQKYLDVEKILDFATIAKIDLSSVNSIYNQKNSAIEITIP